MAVKHLPELALWTITIEPGGAVSASQQNIKIGPTDTIQFRNNAIFPVNIPFTNQLASIMSLPPGETSSAQGGSSTSPLNVTVNFAIVNANNNAVTAGPCSVQFGIGPLPITIDASNTDPDPVAIPSGGQIQFNCIDGGYYITWKIGNQPANVWNPQPSSLVQGVNTPPQTALSGASGQSVAYQIQAKGTETRGGGTVVVSS